MTTLEPGPARDDAHPREAQDSPVARSVPESASAWIEIDLDAIASNVESLRARVGSAEVMAVVKADAYGHGLVPAARAALAGGATWLGVAQLSEALALRAAGVGARILTWIYPPTGDLAGAIASDLDVAIGSVGHLDRLVAAAEAMGRPARVQVKVDTGLARGGTLEDFEHVAAALARAVAAGAVTLTGTFSHFAWADAPTHPTVRDQQDRFVAAVRYLEGLGLDPGIRHLANSAATLTNPGAHFDLVRPGIAVYGLSPVPELGTSADFGLVEAMSVRARLTHVKSARAGQGVSYGHEYHARVDTRLGLVPVGYADGIPRSAGGRGPVLVGGRRLPIAGRVCMDQVMVDLGPASGEQPGDVVTLLGRAARGEPTAHEWASAAGTINYEIVTRMSPRLPRLFLGGQ